MQFLTSAPNFFRGGGSWPPWLSLAVDRPTVTSSWFHDTVAARLVVGLSPLQVRWMELASTLTPGPCSEYRRLQIGAEDSGTISALEALRNVLYKSTTTTTTTTTPTITDPAFQTPWRHRFASWNLKTEFSFLHFHVSHFQRRPFVPLPHRRIYVLLLFDSSWPQITSERFGVKVAPFSDAVHCIGWPKIVSHYQIIKNRIKSY